MDLMLTRRRLPMRFGLLALGLFVVGQARADDWQELVAAEKTFAARTSEVGVRSAFLTALADDSIAFNPGPMPGRGVWTERPENKSTLRWAPAMAEVSISGDLGYALGPWRHTREGDDAARTFGQIFNVWRRQADGEWKLLVSHSIGHRETPAPATVVRRGALATGSPPEWRVGVSELRIADLAPPGRVRPEMVSADFLRLRDGAPPDGVIDGQEFDLRSPSRLETGLVIARAGDLAVTWGGGAGSVRWLRVWRRPVSGDPPGLGWRLAVDLSQAASRPAQ